MSPDQFKKAVAAEYVKATDERLAAMPEAERLAFLSWFNARAQ